MPLSTVCVSTVGGRHKAWPTQGSLSTEYAQDLMTMNNPEEICTFRENDRKNLVPVKKPAYFEYDISDDKPTKKEKKWSFGNLFRRKKKTNDSSSDEELKDKSRKKSDKRKKPFTFDHVVVTQPQVKLPEVYDKTIEADTNLVTSQVTSNQSKSSISDSLSKQLSSAQYEQTIVKSRTSLDNLSRKSRKDLTKVRAEARRTSANRNSSSDEDSQRSNSSQKFRSDESLYRTREASCNRRSRAARTERYLKRHSRDGENPNNYLRISKSDAESTFLRVSDDSNRSPSASPQPFKSSFSSLSSQTPSVIGLSTIPPSHTHHGRFRVSNSTSNSSYKPPLSMNEYNYTSRNYVHQKGNIISNNQRSISFDGNIHRPHEQQGVVYAKLELGKPTTRNLTLMDDSQLRRFYKVYQAPAPPPRDPKRLHGSLILDSLNHNNFHDNSSVISRYNSPNDNTISQVKRVNSVNRSAFKSSSENHIPRENPVVLSQRPSSTTPETTSRKNCTPEAKNHPDNYQYLTDKQPRSRKPIFIQNELRRPQDQKDKLIESRSHFTSKSSFLEQLQAKKSNRYTRGGSPQIFNCETKVHTEIFLPSVLPNNNVDNENVLNGKDESITDKNLDVINQNTMVLGDEESTHTKSANLEEALNELEAIYNSLKLGDEDLLEMAEKRENEVATQKMLESNNQYPSYNGTRGAFSDSGFSYEPFDSLDSRRRRRYSRKSLRSDDMAFRKLHKPERAATITDPQAVASKVSYLLTSPIYTDQHFDENIDPNEPDITLDDVVYRTIKQSNKLKVPEHPPPFGIPLGPITLASNSDYLHAVPDTETVKPSRMPDLVKDDLAFRNLRKDNTKEPALPPVSPDDLRNNNLTNSVPSPANTSRVDFNELKKRRAVRSKSANIGSLISQEVIERASRRNARDRNAEYKTLTDIADAMQIARQVLREKEKKLNENKIGSLSDTDSAYSKYSRFHQSQNEKIEGGINDPSINENFSQKHNDDSFDEMMSRLQKNEGSSEIRRHKVKESTPDPISSFEDGKLAPLFKTNSFEDVLTALAIEAKEASDKFTQELRDLEVEKSEVKEQILDCSSPNSCRKLLEAAVNVNSPKECEGSKEEEDVVLESKATIVFTKVAQHDASIESDHDYVNLNSDMEAKADETLTENAEDNCEGVNAIDLDETQRDNKEVNSNECDPLIEIQDSKKTSGETCVDVVVSNAFSMIVTPEVKSLDFPVSCNDSFNDRSHASCSQEKSVSRIESSQCLKSPKLVLETSKLNESRRENSGNITKSTRNSIQSSSSRNFLDLRNIPEDNHKLTCFFENNAASLAIACSYGIACLYQLAALDLYTILGIILAMFTFIATLFF